mmetsp:Transcript_26251/g.63029  ORF Transcript_26251/g.63029 Transcript_26251/m.63029 type:complete len:188 (-) Transcript_26251:1677-2240(-)|eukprot:CAMPEP_0181127136 /NCGR_PEP_ID=MMETSP1071-20121207/28027_1 /TAXON_ID=35127 /ORGANISM="Thalassiosira sp., Strain NH16" /LENGTH=187 /DNA_ID=CAMNT_0023212835 /DNA_START=100 /DNA_END=663 /DNA_ORIENTATION=+
MTSVLLHRLFWPALLLQLQVPESCGFVINQSATALSIQYSHSENVLIKDDTARLSRNNVLRIYASVDDTDTGGVELVSLAGLGEDHEAVGEMMAKSVAAWLDAEWMPQEVHVKMGSSVKNTYVTCRSKGIEEVAEIMTQVTDDLYDRWSEYDADAFVNAWDVGNYVADYLIQKSGSETCGCSAKIVE